MKAERIVFHFNKAHNKDPNIPPWIIKYKGQTYPVHHVISEVGFTTKETPDNEHTKGSLQFRGGLRLVHLDGEIHAFVSKKPPLSEEDFEQRVTEEIKRAQENGFTTEKGYSEAGLRASAEWAVKTEYERS